MIANERQLTITKARAARFEQALEELERRPDASADAISPLLRQAERDALAGQLATLRDEIAEFESLRNGVPHVFNAASVAELPGLLIRARIARGLAQRDLARQLGLKEQQIQRYEGTNYASASLKRVGQVIEALKVQIHEQISVSGR